MPELPEVETTVRALNSQNLVGQQIHQFLCLWKNTIGKTSIDNFEKFTESAEIISITRRGKNIVFALSTNCYLVFHLKMSGRFIIRPLIDPIDKHEHIVLNLDNLSLRFHDTRKFGRCHLVFSINEFFHKLGPEPLSETFTPEGLFDLLKNLKGKLKAVLLDQEIMVGLGNIYVDESLWLAQLHPLKICSSLTKFEVNKLFKSIQIVLKNGIIRGGTSLGHGLGNFQVNGESGKNQADLNVYRQTGKSCSRCCDKIVKIVVAARSTHICPTCQQP